jgi:8-oxo-dGTP pyrophosphatase MutT (NUDIX family)
VSADLIPWIWRRLDGRVQWRALWLAHATFMVGVIGVIRDGDDQILLLRHKFWTGNPWGLPSGYVRRGETAAQALAREVREETGLRLAEARVIGVRTGFRLRVEIVLVGRIMETASPRLARGEIAELRWGTEGELAGRLRAHHKELIAWARASGERDCELQRP